MNYVQKVARRLWTAHQSFQEHEGTLSAAGIAYYVALSFFPLLLVLVAGLSLVLQWTHVGQNAWQTLRETIARQASPDLAQQVEQSLKVVSDLAPSGGPIGFLVLVVSAIAIFAQLDAAFDRVFQVPADKHSTWLQWFERLVYQRLKALGMLMGVGGFIIVVMAAAMVLSGLEHAMEPRITVGPWLSWASSLWVNLLLNELAFTLVYRVIPKSQVSWRDAFQGGLVSAVLWEVGRQALTAYFLHFNRNAYGIIGSFIAVMLWSYYAAVVILFGAEYVRVLRDEGEQQMELPLAK
jgi:membrane protein